MGFYYTYEKDNILIGIEKNTNESVQKTYTILHIQNKLIALNRKCKCIEWKH